MSIKKILRTVFVCAVLELGALASVPMRPEEIQDLMHQLNRPKLAHVLPSEDDDGNDPRPTARRERTDEDYRQHSAR